MTNYKYYATGKNDKGAISVVRIDSGFRPVAMKEAIEKCKKDGLTFDGLHLEKGSNNAASTMTKFFRQRRKNGQK